MTTKTNATTAQVRTALISVFRNAADSEYLSHRELMEAVENHLGACNFEDRIELAIMVAEVVHSLEVRNVVWRGKFDGTVIFKMTDDRRLRLHQRDVRTGKLAACCGLCGGWTSSGGCSQHADGPDGCGCIR